MPEKKEKQDIFYVGVTDPIEIRRSILESSKEMVQYLQRYEKFKKVRQEKAEGIAKLRETVRELHSLVRKLKASMPKTELRAKLHKHEEELKALENLKEKQIRKAEKEEASKLVKKAKKAKKEKEAAPAEQPRPALSELEKLEAELGEIEGRLTKLA